MIAKASCLHLPARILSISPEFRHKGTGICIYIDSESLDSSPGCSILIYCHIYCITKAKYLSPCPKKIDSLAMTKPHKMDNEYTILYTFNSMT